MANPAPIFTITTFSLTKRTGTNQPDWEAVERSRCVGYYHEFDVAEWAVVNNNGDIYENGYYPYAVIEQVEPGIYPTGAIKHRHFYEWKDDKYVKCDNFDDPYSNVVSYAPIG